MRAKRWLVSVGAVIALAGCAVGSDYSPPVLDLGQQYAALATIEQNDWVAVEPLTEPYPEQWWTLFNDPQLNSWLNQLLQNNLNLAQSEARYRQATATLAQTRSGLWPQLSLNSSTQRSGNGQTSARSQYNLSASASWELDVWGRVRRAIEASDASMIATLADHQALRLSLGSTFVQSYFQAITIRATQRLMDQTIAIYERSLQVNQDRFDAGLVSSLDVAAAQSQLENARAQRLALNRQWGMVHNAMALLLGQTPASFELIAADQFGALPAIPVGVPIQLLTQRPDVAAAERQVAAANAQIGVAKAAWLPNLSLSAQGGYSSSSWSEWLTAPARFWALGPAAALLLFDGGAREARVNEALAAYDAQAANYKQTVLEALKEVEDSLVQWYGLEREIQSQQQVLAAAKQTLQFTENQYEAGLIDYLSIVQAQTSALNAERSLLSLQGELFASAAQLITSLGGGWTQAELSPP